MNELVDDKKEYDRKRNFLLKDKNSIIHKKYYETHKKECSQRMFKNRTNWKMMVFGKLGGVCCQCGFSDIRALQIDHINGDGNTERKEIGSNSPKFYKKVLNDDGKDYQLLCANCNWIKRSENNEINSLVNK